MPYPSVLLNISFHLIRRIAFFIKRRRIFGIFRPQLIICKRPDTSQGALCLIFLGGRLTVCRQFLGFQIPKDICVVGFDNIPAASRISPSLTTISTPQKYLGIAAARQILERIQHPNCPHVFCQYETELIIRNSTNIISF